MAWRGVLVAQRFSWFPYFPPLSWFTVSPFVLVFLFFFSFVFFFVSGICSFHFHWASSLSVIGAMGGGGAGREGARG